MAASGGWLNMDYGYSGRWLILGSGWWQWVVVGDFVFIYIYIYIYIVGVFKVILMCCIYYFNVLKGKIENPM